MNTTRMVISKKKANFNKVMPNELKRDTANKMPTQKEKSLAAAVKFGVGPRGDGNIPSDLKEQLNAQWG